MRSLFLPAGFKSKYLKILGVFKAEFLLYEVAKFPLTLISHESRRVTEDLDRAYQTQQREAQSKCVTATRGTEDSGGQMV
jgi:hypothetical protein